MRGGNHLKRVAAAQLTVEPKAPAARPTVAKAPLGRTGQPADIAASVAVAASPDARRATGSTIDVF